MKVIRVFPRKTKATPDDCLAVIGRGPYMWEEADRVSISVSFTWDRQKAESLAGMWRYVTSDIHIGGPAYDTYPEEFIPGRYLRNGYVITSRGCPNDCWFCDAWKREGRKVRCLPIHNGWDLLDNNILACPKDHVESVFDMLSMQPHRPRFTGGLEAARLTAWHVDRLRQLKPSVAWFAYDEPSDWDPLYEASKLLSNAGLISPTKHEMCCYVLCGYEGDSFDDAKSRLENTIKIGLFPQAMLFNKGIHFTGNDRKQWRKFAREWSNKIIVGSKMKQLGGTSHFKEI